jgi:hypothetical protein
MLDWCIGDESNFRIGEISGVAVDARVVCDGAIVAECCSAGNAGGGAYSGMRSHGASVGGDGSDSRMEDASDAAARAVP